MRVAFFGSGRFALPVLERLHALSGRHELARVVTRPDRPRGRRLQLVPTPVKARAAELGLPCDAPESANDPGYVDALARVAPEIIIVADYGEMIRKRLRELPPIGVFNLHASLLPRHRGAAPIAHALLEGDAETGVTLFRIERGLDTGPVVDSVRCPVGELETAGELEARLAVLAADLLERNLDAFAGGTFRETPQDERLATLAPKLEKSAGAIRWEAPAARLANFIRALNPWPGAYSFLQATEATEATAATEAAAAAAGGSERTIFLRSRAVEPGPGAALAPGTVESVRKDGFRVRCGSGSLEVLEVQREGKAPLDAAAYLRGRRLRPGDRFSGRGEAP
ncbi:MAG: methionyl-tRNA formyltransferase [Planctomycetes bacterium]|nr:methionyl-tRNA formyltransferase [Planctomycetota bacterium]